jgi:very-short-patch-repair endonuclease
MHPDLQMAGLAARQHGYVTRQQLLALGLGPEAIKYRLRTGRLHRIYPGVYAVGHSRLHPVDRSMAAVLACGRGAVLSHASAASLWGFFRRWEQPFEVTIVGDRRPKAIRVHYCRLARADKTHQLGVPVTSPGRTVIDSASRVRNPIRLVNDALHSPWLTESQLIEAIERHPRASLVRAIVLGQPGVTRSELEDRFVAFCQKHRLPQPEINAVVDGREVDAFFREERVIVELDSYAFHSDRTTFERDRQKDAEAAAKGLTTVRLTDERMRREPDQEAARLRTILKGRRPRAA